MNESRSMQKTLKIRRGLIYAFFGILTVLSILPFWLMIINSTRSISQIQQGISLLPGSNLAHNLGKLFGNPDLPIWRGLLNSSFISIFSTAISIYFSALTAYAFTAYEFKGKKFFFGFIVMLIMIPGQVSLIGFYQFMIQLGWLNSYWPLIIPAIAAPGTVFFLVEYMQTIYNKDYADSARLEGAGELKIFHRIMLPMMKPGLATMAIFGFVYSWNNFLMPLLLIDGSDKNKLTLPMVIQELTALGGPGGKPIELGAVYVGLTFSVLPIIIIYLLLSRFIVGGTTAGGVKG
jgi:ABC-type glycerol-3-phosphate transport system permease component